MSNVRIILVTSEQAGQRIDNFLMTQLKGLPKTRIYRAIRKGEVRVNRGRISPDYRIQAEDQVRVPPVKIPERERSNFQPGPRLRQLVENRILYEDSALLVLDKPAGIPVHGGTAISAGLIEILREIRPQAKFLELVHRLDRETSGCLIIAKKRSTLVELHRLLTDREVNKAYLLLVKGIWQRDQKVDVPLKKNVLSSGERIVKVSEVDGKAAMTSFRLLKQYKDAALILARPTTGRTHQIRVHASFIGFPIAGDDKYGDHEFNKLMRNRGLQRLFLHSASIECRVLTHSPFTGVCAMLNEDLKLCLNNLNVEKKKSD